MRGPAWRRWGSRARGAALAEDPARSAATWQHPRSRARLAGVTVCRRPVHLGGQEPGSVAPQPQSLGSGHASLAARETCRRPGLVAARRRAALFGRWSLWLALAAVACCGCRSRPLLSEVSVTPATITPNGDGDSDVAVIQYAVGQTATVSIRLVDSSGRSYVLRDGRVRAPGRYEAAFGGVIAGQMVPDGAYEVVVTAQAPGSRTAESRTRLEVAEADHEPPTLFGFTVRPQRFTPNQDGLDDRVQISYRLEKPAEVRIWLAKQDGEYVTDILAAKNRADDPGSPGPHSFEYDAGVDADAPPPPDGDYLVVAEARDRVGNVDRAQAQLAIRDGGQPRAALLGDVQWSARVIPLGATLWFTVSVANMGSTPLRTRGPEPGTIYDNNTSFNRSAPPSVLLLARRGDRSAVQSVLISQGQPDVRLELKPPGESQAATTSGHPLAGPLGRLTPAEAMVSLTETIDLAGWRGSLCGTVFEAGQPAVGADVYAFESDGDNGRHRTSDSQGRFCFADLLVPPAAERSFARSPGAIRLGLEYDEARTDLEYPYRWQVGPTADLGVCQAEDRLYLCLRPGQTVTVSGGVRFLEPPYRRSTVVYLALLHEDVRRMHGPYGQQRITIEY